MKMLNKIAVLAIAVFLAAAWNNAARAVEIPVPNGDFEDWENVDDWASLGGDLPDQIGAENDEIWSNPSSFGSGWTQLTGRRSDGRWGLQHPNGESHHARDVSQVAHGQDNALSGPTFSGHFIGFANLAANDVGADASGPQDVFEIQSQVLGQLEAGIYTASLAVGFRANASWNDQTYELALVGDGVTPDGSNGSTGGSILGTPGTITLERSLGEAGLDNNQATLSYVLEVPEESSLIGQDYALRIHAANAGTIDGEPSGGGTADFTQANFDNARVTYRVPEPSTLVLAGCWAALAVGVVMRRRA